MRIMTKHLRWLLPLGGMSVVLAAAVPAALPLKVGVANEVAAVANTPATTITFSSSAPLPYVPESLQCTVGAEQYFDHYQWKLDGVPIYYDAGWTFVDSGDEPWSATLTVDGWNDGNSNTGFGSITLYASSSASC